MSRRKPAPDDRARRARADSLETTDGVLEYAKVGPLAIHRDRGGRVLVSLAADPRAHVILTPDEVARAHHALGCALWPYGARPVTDDDVETARERLSRVHGVNLPAKIIRDTLTGGDA